jgi:hypothetical protein
MNETINDFIETTLYELPNGSFVRKTIQKADPAAGIPAGISYIQSFPPDKINVSEEALKNFAEFLIINPAVESKNLEKGIFQDHFEFKVLFMPLNDPDHTRTQKINLAGYVDENEETGFRLEFTPESPFTDSLKKIFLMGYRRIKAAGIIRVLNEQEFKDIIKDGKEVSESKTV